MYFLCFCDRGLISRVNCDSVNIGGEYPWLIDARVGCGIHFCVDHGHHYDTR